MKLFKQFALGLLIAGLLPLSMNARSASVVQVEVLGKTWDVAYVYGTWSDLEELLRSQPFFCGDNCDPQPLDRLSTEFARASVVAGLDLVNNLRYVWDEEGAEDHFATPLFIDGADEANYYLASMVAFSDLNAAGIGHYTWRAQYFAVATPHAVPIPGTLGLLGIGLAGLGFVRRKAKA